jgi:hypothetical protein
MKISVKKISLFFGGSIGMFLVLSFPEIFNDKPMDLRGNLVRGIVFISIMVLLNWLWDGGKKKENGGEITHSKTSIPSKESRL